jgi:hypothetical protein
LENVGIPDDLAAASRHDPGRRILFHFCDCRVESKRGIIRRVKYWRCVSAVDSNICEGEVATIAGLLR